MVASGFSGGANAPHGYDEHSFPPPSRKRAAAGRSISAATALCTGSARGVLLGGCLTLVEATLGTPWELDTRGAILVLEDRGMKPYQVDRALTHLTAGRKISRSSRHHPRRIPGKRANRRRKSNCARSRSPHSRRLRNSGRLGRACRTHASPDADSSSRRSRALERAQIRHARNSRAGGHSREGLTRSHRTYSSYRHRRLRDGSARRHAGRTRLSRHRLRRRRLSASVDVARIGRN